jgi:6-pyruvoyl-tetrahydropterin synthase
MQDVIEPLDHAFLFHKDDPLLQILRQELSYPIFQDVMGALDGGLGDPGRIFLLDFNPTTENMLQWMWPLLEERLPSFVQLEKIKLWETATSFGEKVR